MPSLKAPDESDFTSRLHSPAVAARVGTWLGVSFTICFLTGLASHVAYLPDPWLPLPTSPSWGYRLTQGLHVTAGTAAVPLLLVKLWTVYPKLFARPPRAAREAALHGAERLSILLLVSAGTFQLVTGLANSAQWYPWDFSFRRTHYAVAWVAIGALVVHVAVKLPQIRAAYITAVEAAGPAASTPSHGLSRRGLLRTTWLAAAVAVVATVGSTLPLFRRISVLGVRSGDGPQDVPVNKSARAAGVIPAAIDPSYRLVVTVDGAERSFSRAELEQLRQSTEDLPIACVEGWSAGATWTGVAVRDLLDEVGAGRGRDVRFESLEPDGTFAVSELPANFADDPRTLLALRLFGEPLSIDHGFPCRLIAPNRPGVLQTKWVARVEVLA